MKSIYKKQFCNEHLTNFRYITKISVLKSILMIFYSLASKKDYTPSNNEYSPSSKQSSKYKPSTSSSSKKKNYMVDSNYDNMKLKKKKQQNAYNLSSSSEDDIIGENIYIIICL